MQTTIHDKDNKYTWQNAQDVFIAGLNAENFGGYSDWHLPAREELRSLVDYSISYSSGEPTINKEYFPNTQRSYYWSSSTCANSTDNAWDVNFGSGNGNASSKQVLITCVLSAADSLDHLMI